MVIPVQVEEGVYKLHKICIVALPNYITTYYKASIKLS